MMGLVSMTRWAARLVSGVASAVLAGGTIFAGTAAVLGAGAVTAAPAAASAAGPAHAAAAAQAPRVALLWHTLPLLNGWKSASKPLLVTGTPAWAVNNGVVYFRGAITQPPGGNGFDTVAQLPQGAWPASDLYLSVYTNGDVAGVLYITHTGTVEAYSGHAAAFTSLAGVSYPATTMKSHKLAVENGWVSAQSEWTSGDPSYEVSGGVVYLSGSLMSGTQHLAAVLPAAARPAQTLYVQAYTFDGTTGWVEILPNGNVAPFGAYAKDFTSLAGISFPVATTKWKTFSLEDEWTSGAAKFHTSAPEYTILNGIVYLNGSMYQAKPSNGLFTTLPAGVKTSADVLEIEADAAGGTAGLLTITNSLGLAGSTPFTNAEAFLSLAGTAYPQSS